MNSRLCVDYSTFNSRFEVLWQSRFHAWPRLEEGARVLLKVFIFFSRECQFSNIVVKIYFREQHWPDGQCRELRITRLKLIPWFCVFGALLHLEFRVSS